MSALVVALALPAFAERLHLYDWDIISSLSIELNLEYEVQIEGIFVFVTVPRISHIVGFTVVLGVGRWAFDVGCWCRDRRYRKPTHLFLARPPVLLRKVTVVHFILLHYAGSVQ